jgi:hypothetical protein
MVDENAKPVPDAAPIYNILPRKKNIVSKKDKKRGGVGA